MLPFVIVGLVLVAIVAIYSHYRSVWRRQELTELADRNGWTFHSGKDRALGSRFEAFRCLQQGSNRYAYNLLNGSHQGRALCAFDYHYETYSTDSKGNRRTHHHAFSALVLETGLPLKPLKIRPEGFFDRIAEFFGIEDINFESRAFSRAFHVSAPDSRWAFDVIHQATMEFLLAAPRFHIELAGTRAIVYRSSTFRPEEFEAALQVAAGIIDRLPNYLLREWKGAVG